MIKSIIYKLKGTDIQSHKMEQFFGACRFIYNWSLAKRKEAYELDKTSLSGYDIIKMITPLKKEEGFERLKNVSINSLQHAVLHMDTAYKTFFKHGFGFPKFKSKHTARKSFSIPAGCKIDYSWNGVFIPKIGRVKFFKDKHIDGKIRNATVFAEPDGYYISIIYDDNQDKQQTESQSFVGIDLGIKDFAILSDGSIISNPKFFVKSQKKLRVLSRSLARKSKGSNSRYKAKVLLAKCHLKIRRQREDFLHKQSTIITRKYDCICTEDLNIKGMVKNHKLAKSISDVGRGMFNTMLAYKSNEVIKIGSFEPSSKVCSACSYKNTELTLADRTRICNGCGVKHNRDLNAATNILNRGLTLRASEIEAKTSY